MVTKNINPSHIDSHQTSSNAILSVIPFLYRDTYHKDKIQNDMSNAIATNNPVVVVSDIISIKIQSSKNSPIGSAEVVLSSGHLNYLSLFQAGDHALIWLTNSPGQFSRISNKVLNGESANEEDSGLKFVGKVQSVREVFTTAENGIKTLRYLLTLKSFSEFQAQFYYNKALAAQATPDGAKLDVLMGMSADWQSLFTNNGTVPIETLIDKLIESIIGQGPDPSFATRAGTVNSPNGAYLVPKQLSKYLGLKIPGMVKYSSIINALFGIQRYSGSNYYPNLTEQTVLTRFYTPDRLAGEIIGIPDPFNNNTFISMISAFINPSVNELYCTLKLTPDKKIMPFLVVRQIPFTSKFFKDDSIQHTPFTSLPRWKVDSRLLLDYNLGLSDAARFNFVQAYARVYDNVNQQQAINNQILLENYDIDRLDICRSGVRSLISYSTASIKSNEITNINKWAKLIADFNINQHLKVSGSMTCAGIVEPICIGDNIELDGKLLHIEGLVHSYVVSPTGEKSFRTSIELSSGVLTNGNYVYSEPIQRDDIKSENLPGYSDTESYINEKPIVSTDEPRGTKPAEKNEDKIASIISRMGIA